MWFQYWCWLRQMPQSGCSLKEWKLVAHTIWWRTKRKATKLKASASFFRLRGAIKFGDGVTNALINASIKRALIQPDLLDESSDVVNCFIRSKENREVVSCDTSRSQLWFDCLQELTNLGLIDNVLIEQAQVDNILISVIQLKKDSEVRECNQRHVSQLNTRYLI